MHQPSSSTRHWRRTTGSGHLTLCLLAALTLSACGDDREERPSEDAALQAPVVDQGIRDELPQPERPDAEPPVPDQGLADAQVSPPDAGAPLQHRDLAYDPPPGVQSDLATLDIFRADDDQIRPLVLLVHGGSWAGGDKANFEARVVPWWLEQGYIAAPVNFRLASTRGVTPVVKPGDQVRDLAAALAWLVANAEAYGIATDRILLLGYSSGAHLVALLGTDERYLREAGLDENQIIGAISLDVHAYDVPFALELMVGSVVEQNIPIIRHLFGETEMEQLQGSPIHFLDGWAAPALVISVDEDPEAQGSYGYVVSQAAAHYVSALQATGHLATTIHDITETHASLVGGFGVHGDVATGAILNFLSTLP